MTIDFAKKLALLEARMNELKDGMVAFPVDHSNYLRLVYTYHGIKEAVDILLAPEEDEEDAKHNQEKKK